MRNKFFTFLDSYQFNIYFILVLLCVMGFLITSLQHKVGNFDPRNDKYSQGECP